MLLKKIYLYGSTKKILTDIWHQFSYLLNGRIAKMYSKFLHNCIMVSHLFCTLISENQCLEKLRSILNLRKISGPAELNFFSVHLIFFSVCHLNFFQIYTINLKKSRWQTEKKLRCTEKKFRCPTGSNFFLIVVARAISNSSKNHTFLVCRI